MTSLERLRIGLKRWNRCGHSWRAIGNKIGKTKGWTWFVAHGRIHLDEAKAEEIMRKLPRHLWLSTQHQHTAVLEEIRDNHAGMKKAIKSRYLALQLGIEERMIRSCVNSLRKQGYPICSSVGKHPGFYWPASRKEYEAFKHRDYLSRIKDMRRVVDAMDMGADRLFAGQSIEMELQPELM